MKAKRSRSKRTLGLNPNGAIIWENNRVVSIATGFKVASKNAKVGNQLSQAQGANIAPCASRAKS